MLKSSRHSRPCRTLLSVHCQLTTVNSGTLNPILYCYCYLKRLPQLLFRLAWDPRYIASGRIQQKHLFHRYSTTNTSIVPYVFVAAGTCLSSRCLAMNVYSGSTIPAFRRHVTINLEACWSKGSYTLKYCHVSGFACLTTMSSGFCYWIYWHFCTITTNYNSSQSMTPKTRSIPYCTTSVFSSTATDLVLIYESITSSASVVRWLTLHSWTLNFWILLRLNHWTHEWTLLNWTIESSWIECSGVLYYDRRSVRQSVLEYSTHLGHRTRILLLSDSWWFVDVGRPLWREDWSVVYNSCWPSPVQTFSGPSPVVLVTLFYCLRFETSIFVASYDSQG
jgi:hypothetical protein